MFLRQPPKWLQKAMKFVANSTDWRHLELTSIEYPTNDSFGKFYAIFSQFPVWIFVTLITFVLFGKRKYRKRISLIIIGLLLNELVNKFMKNYIKEQRPFVEGRTLKSFGMPSSHAQFMSFFFVNSFILIRKSNQKLIKKLIDFIIVFLLVIIVSLSRVYLLYHSPKQVWMGIVIGAFFGTTWLISGNVLFIMLGYMFEGRLKEKFSNYW